MNPQYANAHVASDLFTRKDAYGIALPLPKELGASWVIRGFTVSPEFSDSSIS
jgi:hypothetical protein